MTRVVTDAKLRFDDFGDAFARPNRAGKPERFGPSFEQARQLRPVLPRKAGRGAGFGARLQGVFAVLFGAGQPLTDGSLRDAEGIGNGLLFPALLVQLPGAAAAILTQFVILWGGCWFHKEFFHTSADLLDTYSEISKDDILFHIGVRQ